MKFHKYQALGNAYLLLECAAHGVPSTLLVRRLCDRHYGIGSDGVLIEGSPRGGAFSVRIFNPDGSEAEKSGNGLRIFARYLWDTQRVAAESFQIATQGGVVECRVEDAGHRITVAMGVASFDSAAIPVAGPAREVIDEEIEVEGRSLRFTGVGMGNPHCVIYDDAASPDLAQRLGPLLERHQRFPNRTNVQFVEIIDRNRIRIEIWERGAGYTLASGSSSCAAAAASKRLGLCDGNIKVVMPGGELTVAVSHNFAILMTGPASKVAEGTIASEVFETTAER